MSLSCDALLCVLSSLAIILKRKIFGVLFEWLLKTGSTVLLL